MQVIPKSYAKHFTETKTKTTSRQDAIRRNEVTHLPETTKKQSKQRNLT
jgi:hypothetical protein